MECAIGEAFAKLKLLKAYDFHKIQVLTQEQQARVQFVIATGSIAIGPLGP
jgi:hypothetical protein